MMKLEDLTPGVELQGTVLNVVEFGAFLDVGLPDSGLVHISRLADRYVSDPHTVVSVGNVMRVWVVSIDKQRRRVSLTAIEPGTEKSSDQRSSGPSRKKRSDGGKPGRGAKQQGGSAGRSRSGQGRAASG